MIKAAVAALLAGAALAMSASPAPTPVPGTRAGTPVRVQALVAMPFGDSITLGFLGEATSGYRGPLAAAAPLWRWAGSQGAAPLQHEGHGGWRIDQLAAIARTTAATYKPTVILLDAGVNDISQGATAGIALSRMRTLLDELRAGAPSARIALALTTIATRNTPAQQAEQQRFNTCLAALGYQTVDMAGVELQDGIHPSVAGYADMAVRWRPTLTAAR